MFDEAARPTQDAMDDDRAAAIEVIAEAHEHTRAAASARIELLIDHTWEMPPMPRRRRGGLFCGLARVLLSFVITLPIAALPY